MDLTKLDSQNSSAVQTYVKSKFDKFNRFYYPKSAREEKAIQYWIASSETPYGQDAVESAYQAVFNQLFPLEKARARQAGPAAGPAKLEASVWIKKQQTHLVNLGVALTELQQWKDEQRYQEGESFLGTLKNRVEFIDDELCASSSFASDFSSLCKAEATKSSASSATSREAKFEMLIGFQQNAEITFEAYDPNWGEVNAKLEQAFKAGAWASGEAKAELTRLGFAVEAQAAIAMGAQLTLGGEMAWTKGKAGLTLGGEVEVFAGARASAEAKLSVDAINGLEAAFKAGAFVGFSAEVKGSCSFAYDGNDIVKVEASAGVTIGAGAEIEASIKAPIFGPTEVKFAANLTVGFGVSTEMALEIDFTEAGLASSEQFRKLTYARTLAKGYQMDLINDDARNLHYLNKSIKRVETEIESVQETVRSYRSKPVERQSLLVG